MKINNLNYNTIIYFYFLKYNNKYYNKYIFLFLFFILKKRARPTLSRM